MKPLITIAIAALLLSGCNQVMLDEKTMHEYCESFGQRFDYDNPPIFRDQKVSDIRCEPVGEYCRWECRRTFHDLVDTWGVDTNNQDSISKSLLRCISDCKNE